jgi:hypothetical protein
MSTKKLQSLHLEGVSWDTLPSFEQLPYLNKLRLKNVGMRVFGPGFGGVTERSFMHLKSIVFEDMPDLVEWVGVPDSKWYSTLEIIKCIDCPLLCSFPFLEYSVRFTKLSELDICDCPKLPQFPPMPHTSTITSFCVKNSWSKLLYERTELYIVGYNGALDFHNMDTTESVMIGSVSHISFSQLQVVKSLRNVHLHRLDNLFFAGLDESVVLSSVEKLRMEGLCIQGELFSKVLRCFPSLSELTIHNCSELVLMPLEDGGGLGDLTRLQTISVWSCNEMFSKWNMGEVGGAQTIKPFPPSLRTLFLSGEAGLKSMALLSNLTCLTNLHLPSCRKLTMDGFNPLMTANLKELAIYNRNSEFPNRESISIAGDLLSEVARSKLMHAGSFQLKTVHVDSIKALLVAPICSHLAGTLHNLMFLYDNLVESFTEEQEQALQLLTSLEKLTFRDGPALQCLPQGLHRLSSLMELTIRSCKKIQSLPAKEGLPTSLHMLVVRDCSPELTEEANRLKETDSYFSDLLFGTYVILSLLPFL